MSALTGVPRSAIEIEKLTVTEVNIVAVAAKIAADPLAAKIEDDRRHQTLQSDRAKKLSLETLDNKMNHARARDGFTCEQIFAVDHVLI